MKKEKQEEEAKMKSEKNEKRKWHIRTLVLLLSYSGARSRPPKSEKCTYTVFFRYITLKRDGRNCIKSACVYVWVYFYVYVKMREKVYVYVCERDGECICIYVHVCMYMYVCSCMCVSIDMHICCQSICPSPVL